MNQLDKQIFNKKRENKSLDKKIQMLNVDVAEQNYLRDVDFERESVRNAQERYLGIPLKNIRLFNLIFSSRMQIILERSKVVRIIQQQHSQILELTTLLELQRLKTYPTLSAHAHYGKHLKHIL